MARTHYTQGPGDWGQLVSQRQVDTSTSTFYSFDGQANTRLLISTSSALSDSYSYKAFGEELSISGSTPNPHRFGGQVGYYRDKVERVYVRARHYAPPAGRWLCSDPIRFDGGDFNLYRYVENNPVNAVDPMGLACWCCNDYYFPPVFCCGPECRPKPTPQPQPIARPLPGPNPFPRPTPCPPPPGPCVGASRGQCLRGVLWAFGAGSVACGVACGLGAIVAIETGPAAVIIFLECLELCEAWVNRGVVPLAAACLTYPCP